MQYIISINGKEFAYLEDYGDLAEAIAEELKAEGIPLQTEKAKEVLKKLEIRLVK